jgi:uncharacterized damage-inducible protein DinB
MQQIQPEQAEFLLNGLFIPALKNEHRTTKNIIDAIPQDKGDYRPDGISKSALDLAWHIVVTEMRFMESVCAGEFDLSPRPRPESIRNSAELVGWYTDNFERHLGKLTALPSAQLTKTVDFRGLMQLPAVMFLNLMMHHSVHHRGQLSMYLRPMGAKVPAIYGESFDSAEARKARA